MFEYHMQVVRKDVLLPYFHLSRQFKAMIGSDLRNCASDIEHGQVSVCACALGFKHVANCFHDNWRIKAPLNCRDGRCSNLVDDLMLRSSSIYS